MGWGWNGNELTEREGRYMHHMTCPLEHGSSVITVARIRFDSTGVVSFAGNSSW